MNKLYFLAAFASGAAIGSVATWLVLNKKCEDKYEKQYEVDKEALEESYSSREHWLNDDSSWSPSSITAEESFGDDHQMDIFEYSEMLKREKYKDYSAKFEKNIVPEEPMNKPYIISPEEFYGSEYKAEALHYWSDKTLTDDHCNVIENPDEIIGNESLLYFGEYEEDSVYVRNDALMTDFEILLEEKPWHAKGPSKENFEQDDKDD